MTEPRVIGEWSDFASLRTAINARVEELRLSGETIDRVAGLPDRYFAKIFGARPVRRPSLATLILLLGATGTKCLLVEDEAAMIRLAGRLPARDERYVQSGAMHVTLTRKFMRKIGRKGAVARWKNVGKRERRRHARRAALARWGRQ